MIELSVSLASNGVVKVPGYEQLVRFGYTKNWGVYRLAVTASGEWEGLTIRAFWHVPDGKDPASSLVVDGYVAVPAALQGLDRQQMTTAIKSAPLGRVDRKIALLRYVERLPLPDIAAQTHYSRTAIGYRLKGIEKMLNV